VYDGDKTINGGWGKNNEALMNKCQRLNKTKKQMQDTYYRHKMYAFWLKYFIFK